MLDSLGGLPPARRSGSRSSGSLGAVACSAGPAEAARCVQRSRDPASPQRDRAAAHDPARVRAGRPVPVDRRPRAAADSARHAACSLPRPRVEPSVLRVTATACGLGVEGSGWVARPARRHGRTRRAGAVRGSRRRTRCARTSSSIASKTSRSSASRPSRAGTSHRRRPRGRLRRDPRLPRERPLRRAAGRGSARPPTCSSRERSAKSPRSAGSSATATPAGRPSRAGAVEATIFAARSARRRFRRPRRARARALAARREPVSTGALLDD